MSPLSRRDKERLRNVAKAGVSLGAIYAARQIVKQVSREGETGQVYITPYDNFMVEKLSKSGKGFLRLSGRIIGLNRETADFEELEHDELPDIPKDEIAGFEKLLPMPPEQPGDSLQTP